MKDLRTWDPGPALRRHLEMLVGERSPLGTPDRLKMVESYVDAEFRNAGLLTRREAIGQSKGAWQNVIGDALAAADAPLFVIGAHFDSVERSPGADDNASGVAALLALAERFGTLEKGRSATAIRFAAFNLEEWGMVGSQEHAEALKAVGRRVSGMISLEMIGYVDERPRSQGYPPGIGFGRRKSGDFISVVGNMPSRRLVKDLASAFAAEEELPVESAVIPGAAALLIGAALSDHSSFWRYGYQAVMVGDTAFYRNPNYHRETDTLETLSLPFLEKVTRGLSRYLESLTG
jgi:Zn-dependent M28 family amino/carboxypeptidase